MPSEFSSDYHLNHSSCFHNHSSSFHNTLHSHAGLVIVLIIPFTPPVHTLSSLPPSSCHVHPLGLCRVPTEVGRHDLRRDTPSFSPFLSNFLSSLYLTSPSFRMTNLCDGHVPSGTIRVLTHVPHLYHITSTPPSLFILIPHHSFSPYTIPMFALAPLHPSTHVSLFCRSLP